MGDGSEGIDNVDGSRDQGGALSRLVLGMGTSGGGECGGESLRIVFRCDGETVSTRLMSSSESGDALCLARSRMEGRRYVGAI